MLPTTVVSIYIEAKFCSVIYTMENFGPCHNFAISSSRQHTMVSSRQHTQAYTFWEAGNDIKHLLLIIKHTAFLQESALLIVLCGAIPLLNYTFKGPFHDLHPQPPFCSKKSNFTSAEAFRTCCLCANNPCKFICLAKQLLNLLIYTIYIISNRVA